MSRLAGGLYAVWILVVDVVLWPLIQFVDQAVLGHSPLNPKE